MVTFALLAIIVVFFVLFFKHKTNSGYAKMEVTQSTIIYVGNDNGNFGNFIISTLRRKRRRTRIKIGAVF